MRPFILLISPPRTFGGKDLTYENMEPPEYPPLNLAYLASNLEKHDYEVEIIDSDVESDFRKKITNLIKKSPLLIGLTCTTPLFGNARLLAKFIKEQADNIPIVLGGIHATLMPYLTAQEKMFDFLVVGEGELTLVELADMLKKKETEFSKIDGLVFRKNDQIIINQPRQQINNLDDLPFPRRDLFKNHAYKYPDVLYTPAMPIITSRGCPGVCTYCASRDIFPRVKFRSAQNVVEEIEDLIKNYGAKEIHIWDDCFTLLKKRVFAIRDLLKEKNIKTNFAFPNGLRADYVNFEILKALKNMGTYSVSFGVESGSQKILDTVKKKLTLEQIRTAFRDAKKLNLETWGFFMIGLPCETEEDINRTVEFAKEIDADIVKFNILIPFPGTEAYNQLLKDNLIIEKDFSKYGYHSRPVHRLPTLTADDLIRLHSRAYRAFYLRPRKLLQQVFRLKSWTRISTNLKTGLMVFRIMFKKNR